MQYRVYSAEYKIAMIEEYHSRNVTIRAFCKEKDLCLSTFESWLTKVRKYGKPSLKMVLRTNNDLTPIDVTNETKMIIKEEMANFKDTFILETRGMKLTFSINNLKEVLEVINND